MKKTITKLYDTYSDAVSAVSELKKIGVPESDISLITNNSDETRKYTENSHSDAGIGAVSGGVLGGAGGLLAGLGLLAIPGLGPVVTAGWLASMAVGAGVGAAAGGAAGGLLEALKENGINEDDAHVYSESVRQGGTLISAKVDEELRTQADAALNRNSYVDIETRRKTYSEAGWKGYTDRRAGFADERINDQTTM